jgi:Protein of unknown function (DUF4011)
VKPVEIPQEETGQKASSLPPYEEHKKILWKKLETYRDKLLRLEQSNRSILLRRIYAKWSFDLAKLSIRGNPIEQLVIERAFQNKNAICLIPDSDDSDLANKERTKLKSLYRTLSQIELETGLLEAYFGFPFLVGHVGIDTYVRAPLVLFPITIVYRKLGRPSGWYLVFSRERPSIINRALMALLKKRSRLTVADSFFEQFEDIIEEAGNFDKSKMGIDPPAVNDEQKVAKEAYPQSLENFFVQKIINLLINSGFPASLSEKKLDEIKVLEPLSSDQQLILQKEELHLVNYKIIGNFPQGNTAIYTDYEELMKRAESGETNQGIIDNLLEIPSPEDYWYVGEEEIVPLPGVQCSHLDYNSP